MKKLALLLGLLAIFLFSGTAKATTYTCDSCDSCTTALDGASSSDIVQMNSSINDTTTAFCIIFTNKENVTLDCQGYTIYGNGYDGAGIKIAEIGGGSNNVVKNCKTQDFSTGLYFDNSASSGNLIYNNLFNATTSVYFLWEGADYFNISITNSTNIIGGSQIGGNYWANPNGTGFSQTCDNTNNDSFCDSGYTIGSSNMDFLPLTINWTQHIPTTYQCDSCDSCNSVIAGALAGDIVELNTSISNYVGTCISFGGTDSITFDCLGNTIDGDDSGIDYGIWLNQTGDGSNNNTLKNCIITDFYYGIFLRSSSNNILNNITSNYNLKEGILLFQDSNNNTISNSTTNYNGEINANNYGIVLDNVTSNTLTNIVANYNVGSGILLQNASYNNLTSITASFSTRNISIVNYGIVIYLNSNNNILSNIITNSNIRGGIIIDIASNNTITNLTSNNNIERGGLFIYEQSQYNTIKDSRFENNSAYGIYLDATSGYSNTFYNNFLNNTGIYFNPNSINILNTTIQTTTNIIGGSQIGGNYWGYPNGTGFSQTCLNQNSDSFCDSAFILNSNSTDFIPLTSNLPIYLTINWNKPANNSFTLNLSSILWNATIGGIPNSCILNINGTANYSMLISGNYCYYTTPSLTNQTTYCGSIYANNSISNVSYSQCATINLTSGGIPPTPPTPRPIDNLGLLAGVALLIIGAGILLFILEALFSEGNALLKNPKNLVTIIIGAIIMAVMILALL